VTGGGGAGHPPSPRTLLGEMSVMAGMGGRPVAMSVQMPVPGPAAAAAAAAAETAAFASHASRPCLSAAPSVSMMSWPVPVPSGGGASVGGVSAAGSVSVPSRSFAGSGSVMLPTASYMARATANGPLPVAATVVPQAATMPSNVQMPVVPPFRDLADPDTINSQKENYARDLEEQLSRGVEVLGDTHRQQTETLHAAANQEKTRYNLAMDQQVKQQELFLSQEYNEQLMRLQQAAQAKRAELEQQATGLTLEFQQRKVQEEFMAQQLGIQQQHMEAQSRLQEEMRKLGIHPGLSLQGPLGTSPGSQGFGLLTPLLANPQANFATAPQQQPAVSYAAPPMTVGAPSVASANGVVHYVAPPTTAGVRLPSAGSTVVAGGGGLGASMRSASTFVGVPQPQALSMYGVPPRSSRPSLTGSPQRHPVAATPPHCRVGSRQ